MTKINNKITIEIDGERFEVVNDPGPKVSENGNGSFQFNDGNALHKITVLSFDLQALKCTVEINGQLRQVRIIRELDLLIEKMGMNASLSRKQSVMGAPMPGLVTAIKVAVGDHVVKGTPLLILEAMKMENVISAPHEAVIKEINVSVGQAVERGLPLVEFESKSD